MKKQRPFEIGYVTEDPTKKYSSMIRSTRSKEELIDVLSYYKILDNGALKIAKGMNDKDFGIFKNDLSKAKKEQTEQWINYFNERWGEIVMPKKMILTSLICMQFVAPWGCAFIRGEEIGWDKIGKK